MSEKMAQTREEISADTKKEWDADAGLRAEFGQSFDRFLAYRTAAAGGMIKTLAGQVRNA